MKIIKSGYIIFLALILFLPLDALSLTSINSHEASLEPPGSQIQKKAPRVTYKNARRKKKLSYSAQYNPNLVKKSYKNSGLTNLPGEKIDNSWIPGVGKIYLKPERTMGDRKKLYAIIEKNLGINPDGSLDIVKTRDAGAALRKYREDPEKEFSNIYFDDKQSLVGYNYIYFEVCTLNKDKQSRRFKRYFENGFYPHRSLYIKEEYYYRSLYYYLYIIHDTLINKINAATTQLNKHPKRAPSFTKDHIKSFAACVEVCGELDQLRIKGSKVSQSAYDKIFSYDERTWINSTISYFTDIDTHMALSSYNWFRANLPPSISAQVIARNTRDTWIDQTLSYKTMLPLMLFTDKGDLQFSVEELFSSTLNKLKLDNREVDILVMSALKTWLSKQIGHGIKVKDRIKYKEILDELVVCPSGLIFYNLYSCRKPLDSLKSYALKWDSYSPQKKENIFNKKIVYIYGDALEKINKVFSELEKLFGKTQSTSFNETFHRYRGEINYYFEYLQFGLYEKNLADIRFPLANSRKNCLTDFKAAFIEAFDKKINHANLLKAYNLLFKELASQGKLNEIMKYEEELESFIGNDKKRLGFLVGHSDDDRYEIYKTISGAYLSNKKLHPRALKAAEKSYNLARGYYVLAAGKAGYIKDGKPGALNNNCTEIDDFERQFEFYQKTAGKLGKKAHDLLPGEDLKLYKKLQDLRNPQGFLL